jgi:hypothetical protein
MTPITPNGKEIEIYNEGFAVLVRFKGGGELPEELKGSWTNKTFAMKSINQYLDKLEKREEKKSKG